MDDRVDTAQAGAAQQRLTLAALALLAAAAWPSGATWAAPPPHPLNDTGATQCLDTAGRWTTVCTGTGQDGEFGRDVTKPAPGNGFAGFAFTRVCNSGEMDGSGNCPKTPAFGPGLTDWGCTYDTVTKLMWELKTDDGGLRDKDLVYTDLVSGIPGYAGKNDADGFVAAINFGAGLCGHKDWRLPRAYKLQSIVHYGLAGPPALAIDTKFFPNTVQNGGSVYWTSNAPPTVAATAAYFGSFTIGTFASGQRSQPRSIRLVRTGP